MSFKTVSFAVAAAILLGGCAFWQSDPKPIAPENTSKKAGLSMFNKTLNDVKLPQKITIDGDKFVLKHKDSRTAEFYLPSEQVGFKWTKLTSVTIYDMDIQKYRDIVVKGLKDGKYGKAEYDFKFLNDKEYQGYTIYEPIAGNPDFDNYEINLIHAKRLNCGLRVVHYALKFPNSARKDKFAALIKQKMPIFLAQMPQVECK